ncbi:hypothetical protein [Streptomyces finlayi]|uniref:hypothetical protein n=1 Tax=Streptomyces finlayi TaxID=67296 RepID=UPI0021562A1E|nr:hypothetical protein [Streptomyces finlayi]
MPDAVPGPVAVQPVVAPLTHAALILVGTIEAGGGDAVRDMLPDLPPVARSLGFRYPDATQGSATSTTAICSVSWTAPTDAGAGRRG